MLYYYAGRRLKLYMGGVIGGLEDGDIFIVLRRQRVYGPMMTLIYNLSKSTKGWVRDEMDNRELFQKMINMEESYERTN